MRSNRLFALGLVLGMFSLSISGASPAVAAESEGATTSANASPVKSVDFLPARLFDAQFCRATCPYDYPIVTADYVGLGATCQDAQANLDGQVSSYAHSVCSDPSSPPCGVYTVITHNCYYNSTQRQYQMNGYGTFNCIDRAC